MESAVKRKRTKSFEDFETNVKIESLKDLIRIGEEYKMYYTGIEKQIEGEVKKDKKFNKGKKKLRRQISSEMEQEFRSLELTHADFFRLQYITEELKELDNLIGLRDLKKSVVNQILFIVQDFHKDEFMNIVLYAGPGCGKTTVSKILGKIYAKLGMLSNGQCIYASRNDLIGQYLGHTAAQTKKFLESARGNVLIFDEIYQMGSSEGRDSFAKEAIDTINQFLSENSEDFIMIICGYEKEVKECFFAQNQGLERRFNYRFHMEDYEPDELKEILKYQIKQDNWTFTEDFINSVKIDKALFKNNGGDTFNFFTFCKTCHAKRVFGMEPEYKKVLTKDDYNEGMKMYKDHLQTKQKQNTAEFSMYI